MRIIKRNEPSENFRLNCIYFLEVKLMNVDLAPVKMMDKLQCQLFENEFCGAQRFTKILRVGCQS